LTRITLERRQVWVYMGCIVTGLALGSWLPSLASVFELLIWPALLALLYATFVQVPLLHLEQAFADRRFISAVLVGNFMLMPLAVWALVQGLPDNPALRLGVLLVLLVPCTDWFITFTQLGGGDVPRAAAVTPVNLLVQLLLLPFYLWLMVDTQLPDTLGARNVLPALLVVLLPLVAALITERWMCRRPERNKLRERLAWWPVPLLGLVVLLIAGAQVSAVLDALDLLPRVVPVFIAYLIIAAGIAKLTAKAFHLPAAQSRTLAFSLGTRNSFLVLPFALALPQGWEVVAMVIVIQSLVELFGMLAYLRWVPGKLFR